MRPPSITALPYRPLVLGIYGLVGTFTAISMHLSLGEIDRAIAAIARERGAVLFRLIEQTREWNARHGGVYVPVTEETRPNPNLRHPLRDITDENGRALTMINPAFMTRQIAEIAERAEGIRFHITSLKPIRPANMADAWENRALKSFEIGEMDEKLEFFPDGGGIFTGPTHRYMAPLHVKPACMRCHADQGYKVGDIRGGISISMPADGLAVIARQRRLDELWQHLLGAFAVAGLGHLLVWRARRSYRALREINQRQEAIIAERTHELREANTALEGDIDARRRAEAELEVLVTKRTAALREAETRYRTVADFTYDWETWIDPEERWLYCSPSSERITGHAAHEFMRDPKLFLDIIHPEDRAKMADHLHESHREAGRFTVFNFRVVRPDGSLIWLEHACQPVFDETGRHLGQRASNRDITERIQAEATLSIAKDAAEAANRAKSAFLANMSHELRTPLNAILGFAQILEGDSRIPGDARHNLATINRSGRHLLTLINDVLDLSRIEAGRAQVMNEVFELREALLAVEEMIRIRADAKNLDFIVEHPADLPRHVLGDAHRLRQVLINLLGNAVKYTDQGRITLRTRLQPEHHIRFEVGDTGPGIAREDQEHIFQAFYQTEAGSAKGEGTGLGLAISREFVRLMGGELTVESVPDQGSRFSFSIPLTEADTPPHASHGGRVVGLAAGQPAPHILIAEDNADNQQVVLQLLARIGAEARIARDGREAVDLFQSWLPQLILMDMRMPEMDGYAATRAIRALPAGATLPIVALTASAFEEDRDKVLAAGCDEMVRKPVEETRLFEVIGQLLGLTFDHAEVVGDAAPPAGGLTALPAATLRELADAASALDKEAILEIVARLRASHADEAHIIAGLVENYRFDLLLEHCGGA